jgi:N-glycosylase/DNA lyase
MWFLTENGEDGFAYYVSHHHHRDVFDGYTDYENYIKHLEENRQISLTVLEEYCGFSEEEAFGLMQEIELLFYADRIHFNDIATIEHVERTKDTVSLSVKSIVADSYTVVISTVNRPIILSITDSKGKVLYESNEL